jgi:hypothetical protein
MIWKLAVTLAAVAASWWPLQTERAMSPFGTSSELRHRSKQRLYSLTSSAAKE